MQGPSAANPPSIGERKSSSKEALQRKERLCVDIGGGVIQAGDIMNSNPVEKAKRMMQERTGQCAQAVLTSLGEEVSAGTVDYDTLMKISSAFSGGIARTGNVCGALTGALMVIGLKYGGSDSTKANDVAKRFLDEFSTQHGSTICRELIDHDLISDSDVEHAFKTGAFDNCDRYVVDAVLILEKLL